MANKMISVLIPARNEIFLHKTIKDLLAKARGEIEVIAVLDGYWPPTNELIDDPRVVYLHFGQSGGMRNGINSAAAIAKGEYLMKSDAHCMFDEGFDLKLKEHIPEYVNDDGDDNWIVIPRRLRLDAENWTLQETEKPPVDYEFLSSPADAGIKGNKWNQRTVERMDILIDETMSFQGSCWFMTKNHYINRLGGMNSEGYGDFVREAQEIGLKTFLSGGRVYTNKHTWYAHLHKGKTYGRMYFLNSRILDAGNKYCDSYWFGNKWEGAKYDLAWLIERFGGDKVPTWTKELIESVRKK